MNKFIRGQRYFPFFKGKGFRGVPDFQDKNLYKKGEIVTWKGISSMTKNKEMAEMYTNENGTLFEIELVSAKDISSASYFPCEDEIIVMPYSYLEVIDVKDQPGQTFYVYLREISAPQTLNLILWVEDNPENVYEYARNLEISGKSVVFAQSTQDAIKFIDNFIWLLNLKETNLKIVTDMTREENGILNYQAGIDLVEALFSCFDYNFKILCFCSNTNLALKNAKFRNVNDKFEITSYEEDLKDFLFNN